MLIGATLPGRNGNPGDALLLLPMEWYGKNNPGRNRIRGGILRHVVGAQVPLFSDIHLFCFRVNTS